MYDAAVAELYELEHGSFDDDAHLYSSYALRTGGPVLELGCGTGRLMLPLVRAGYEVVGVDFSEAMLNLARAKLAAAQQAGWELIHGDVRDLDGLPRQHFGMAFSALNSWAHLTDLDDALRVLEGVRAALRPAGLLVIDLEDPERWSPGRGELVLGGVWDQPEGTVIKLVASVYDNRSGVEDVMILWDNASGGAVKRTIGRARMRPYRKAEMELLLARAGFGVEEELGSWELENYSGHGDRLILVATRLR